jgi:small GTP-binding protein
MELGEYVTTPALKNASLRKSMNRYSTLKISAKYTELAMLEQLAAAEEAALAAAQASQAQAPTPLDGSTSSARVVDGIVREPNSPVESKNGGLSSGLESSPPASSSPLDSPATTPEKEVKSSRDKDKSKVKKKKKGKTTITSKEKSSEDPLPSEIPAGDGASIEGSTTADTAATSSNASTTHERGEANLSSGSAPESNPESPSGSRVPKDASSSIDLQVAPRKESGGLRLAIDKIPARQQSSILPSESNAASTSGEASSSSLAVLPAYVEVDREEFLKDDNIRTQVYLEDLDFSQLRELRLLHLQANNLESVPKSLGYCTALIDLDLAENRLTEFPLALCELKSLVRLSLASNDISVLPEAFSQLSRLVELYLDENKLGTLPLGISRFQSLRALHVSHNKLRQLPHNFGKLPNLVELNLSHNDLQIFPTELIHLRPLQYLAIDANSLKVLPNDLFYLSSLKSLEARDNLLSNIPYSSLLHLECLQLDNNRIEALPKMIGLLHKISDLSFNGNPLREIPEEIGYLSNLVRLDLSNMPIAQLPESICLLPRLKKLLLQGNDNMTWPDPEQANVLETESLLETMVKDRFGAMKQSSQSRVCFVGLEGSGKSTLFNHLKSGKFQKKIKPTRGIGFETWMPKSEVYEGSKTVSTKMSFNVWDFSGNEDYRILHQLFVSEGAVYVIVWNLALDESRSTIGYWLNTIEAHAGPNAPILIVGTHLDNLKDSEKVMELLERKYYNDRYPSVRGIIAVSSSNGQNIERVSKKICQLAYDLRRSVMVPASFQKALAAIPKDIPKEGPTPAPIMEIHNFDKFLAKFQIDELQATSALRYLSSVGAVVHLQSLQFDDVVGVITDPAWFVDVYSDIFSQRAKFLRDGILRHETLEQAWKDTGLPSLAHYTLVAVLHKLEMCFDDGSHLQKSSRNFYNNQSKFPSFLPEVPPEVIPWPQLGVGQEEISMAHKFSFIPVSLMPKLMCRLFTRLRPLAFWRHGFVVQSLPDVLQPNAEPEMSAYVEITAKHDLRVWIRGSHMFSCMKLFQAILLKILASFRHPPSVTLHRHLHCAFRTSMETQVELVAVSMHKVEFEISRGVTVLQLTTGGQIPLTHIHNDMAESISIIP